MPPCTVQNDFWIGVSPVIGHMFGLLAINNTITQEEHSCNEADKTV